MDMEWQDVNISLTAADKAILASYSKLCDGLSTYLGAGYEIVLHSLEDCSHSAIKVINGYHTGRREGAPITDLALSMLERIRQDGNGHSGGISYFTTNSRGEPLKSATLPLYGEGGRIIGLLCMNFYLNTPFSEVLQTYCRPKSAESDSQLYETFTNDVDNLIFSAVNSVRDTVYADATVPVTNKNKEIIHILSERGVFNLKDGVVRTAELLNISKNTVYLHLRNQNTGSAAGDE